MSASREESEKTMGTRLYVGNLPYDVDEAQLRGLFEKDGRQVSEVKIVMDRDTGRPRGFAFVEMGSQADASGAISALNGTELGGRALTVNEARESAPNRGGGGFGRGRQGGGGRNRF
jgi:RNA recognition motif-containing protein